MTTAMLPPVTYQGGKGRLAAAIVDAMRVPADATFVDICCGSGAVTLALLDSGHDPGRIVMIDQGPWGMFWRAIGEGSFDLAAFRAHIRRLPTDPRHIKAYIATLHSTPVGPDAAQVFLLLQACAIGGKAISITDGAWRRGAGFRDYWLPTAVSSRRSPVNPMMPMPATILDRVETIARRARGLIGICGDASLYRPPMGAVGYIDPPYRGTSLWPFLARAGSQKPFHSPPAPSIFRQAEQREASPAIGAWPTTNGCLRSVLTNWLTLILAISSSTLNAQYPSPSDAHSASNKCPSLFYS